MFGYGKRFISFIKLLHQGSTSVIENNGHFSKNKSFKRVSSGGSDLPIYLRLVCRTTVSHCIRECGDIKWIEVHGTEIAVLQYADDTTLFLEGSLQAIKRLMSILGWFRKISGLSINVHKTKAVKIGALRESSLPWEGKYGMEWTEKFTVLGVQYNVNKINDLKKLVKLWQARKLSPYSKVTVIKSLFLSKITHLLLSLPSPNKALFKEINTLFKNFSGTTNHLSSAKA